MSGVDTGVSWSADSTPEVVQVLLRVGADVHQADRTYGLVPRHWAERTRNQAALQLLDGDKCRPADP